MPSPRALAAALVVAVALGGAGYGVYRYLQKPPEQVGTITPPVPHTRKAVTVPTNHFTDVTEASGVRFHHVNGATPLKLLPETMGGGVAVLDFDCDGLPDLFFANGREWPGHGNPAADTPNPTPKLYRNLGRMKFADATETAGFGGVEMYGMGTAVGDYDNDGRPDVFVSCIGKHRLFRNVDGKRFEETTATAGVGGPGDLPAAGAEAFDSWKPPIPFGSSATFVDYDGDGKLDLFVCHYVTWSPAIDRGINSSLTGAGRTYQQPQRMDGAQCRLYRNLGNGRFEDVSASAGVFVNEREGTAADSRQRAVGKALGVVICDPDGDGWPDLIVANDTVRNFYFHNEAGDGGRRVFVEHAYPAGAAYADEGKPRGGMGIDWGEFAPGRSACVIANFANEPVTFLERSRGGVRFSDAALSVGLAGPSRQALKFGCFFWDYDNDGRLDLFVCNGHIEPDITQIQSGQRYAQPPLLFWNTGDSECYFEPVTEAAAGPDLFRPLVGRGSAFADLDGDGDLDLILAANGGPARVMRNDAPNANKWVRFDLRGDGATANRSAIGAELTIEAGGKTFTRHVAGARGYLSQSEPVVTVGLGSAELVDKLTVRWPGKDAGTTTDTSLAAGRTHILTQSTPKP